MVIPGVLFLSESDYCASASILSAERLVVDADIVNQAGKETACIKGLAGTNVLVGQQKRAASVILTALQFGDTNCTLCPAFSRRCWASIAASLVYYYCVGGTLLLKQSM